MKSFVCPVWLVVAVLRKTASATVAPSSVCLWIIAHFQHEQQIIQFATGKLLEISLFSLLP